jgi:hypothetical protein
MKYRITLQVFLMHLDGSAGMQDDHDCSTVKPACLALIARHIVVQYIFLTVDYFTQHQLFLQIIA